MKKLTPLLLVPLLAAFLTPVSVLADGMFVVPKFVWDKHKDINEPTQKAILVYDAGREDLILQVKYEGPVDEFGWLIPVPNLPTVQNGSMKCFYELSQYTQKHFEWGYQNSGNRSIPMSLGVDSASAKPEPPVKVIEIKTVGAYEIAVLSTKDSSALAKWLETNQFYFPTNKTDVLDGYIKQQWYFVAVKINLGKTFFNSFATAGKLAAGELNPLQISFASDHCVFPLKISSVNGQPSEVQVYILSPEPLLERTMIEKQLPAIYSNDLLRAEKRAQSMKNLQMLHMATQIHAAGGKLNGPSSLPPFLSEDEKRFQKISQTPVVGPDDLLHYAKVTNADLPETSKLIQRLGNESWWLTKQTWTFKPEEMRDLEFTPAISYFVESLDSKYGYFAAESLAQFGSDAVPAFLTALRDTNPAVRASVAAVLNPMDGPIRDPRLTAASIGLLKDSEPKVRALAAVMLAEDWNSKYAAPLIEALNDNDIEVRWMAGYGLAHHLADITNYIPHFQAMLKDSNPGIRAVGYELLRQLRVPVSREDLSGVFAAPSMGAVWNAYEDIEKNGWELTDSDVTTLLQNSDPNIRGGLGLKILSDQASPQSVTRALQLLRDPEILVRMSAARTLRTLTGQQFSEDQTDEWEKWWQANKTNFVAQSQPEESHELPDGMAYHVRGCEDYDRQNFGAALADFKKSCGLGSEFQDYSYYRIWLIRARSGEKEAATQELVSYLKNRKAQNPPDWPLQVGRFLAGQITEADILKAAANANSKTDREQHCEAYFYAGSKRLIENDKTGAADYFKKCINTGVTNFEEYQSADAELRVLH